VSPSTTRAPGSDREARIREIHRRLREVHGAPEKQRRDPLEELLLTILSQNTSDTNRDRAWRRLRERFPDWEAVRTADPGEVEDAIRPGGLAGQKSRAIRGALERLHEERGEASLDHLEEMDDEAAMDYLTGFPRVGTKTAACVLCFALGRPVIPVDTHVDRVARRLGLVEDGGGAEAAHRALNREVPPGLRFSLHLLLIRHGRATCTARSPDCPDCVLEEMCPKHGLETS
jgi:endonuclease-3